MRYDMRGARLLALSLALSVTLPAARKGNFSDAVQESSGIVLGHVITTSSYYGNDGEIYTDVTMQVASKVKDRSGRLPLTLAFTVPGGEVGDIRVVFSETPTFTPDEPVLLMLDGNGQPVEKFALEGDYVPALGRAASEALEEIVQSGEASPEFHPRLAKRYLDSARAAATLPRDAVACYALMGPKWNSPAATYKVSATIPTAWSTGLTNGVTAWNGAGSAFRFSLDANSANAVNFGAIAGSSSILAQTRVAYYPSTNRIANFTLTFNSAHPWSTTGESGKFDVQGIFAHEMGHGLGLDHPSDSSCSAVTMWASARSGDTSLRTLEEGDKQGVIALYGSGGGSSTPPPPPPPAPTTPTLNSLTSRPSAPRGNQPFTLVATGTNFQSTLQFVIRGGSCPTAGCVVTGSSITPTSALGSTRLSSGTYTVGVRNSASGTLSATRNLNVR